MLPCCPGGRIAPGTPVRSGIIVIAISRNLCHILPVGFHEGVWPMGNFIRGKVSGAGRVVLPSELRKELGIEDGADVVFCRTEYGIQITTLDQAIRQAQAMVRRYVPEGVSLVDELHDARRQDATFA